MNSEEAILKIRRILDEVDVSTTRSNISLTPQQKDVLSFIECNPLTFIYGARRCGMSYMLLHRAISVAALEQKTVYMLYPNISIKRYHFNTLATILETTMNIDYDITRYSVDFRNGASIQFISEYHEDITRGCFDSELLIEGCNSMSNSMITQVEGSYACGGLGRIVLTDTGTNYYPSACRLSYLNKSLDT